MTIAANTMKLGATFPTTGGSSYPLASSGSDLNKHLVTDTFNALGIQVSLDYSVVRPKPLASAPNGYTQGRREVFIKMPVVLANGKYTTHTAKVIFNTDIEISDASNDLLRDLVVQSITGTALDGFYRDLSTA